MKLVFIQHDLAVSNYAISRVVLTDAERTAYMSWALANLLIEIE